MSLVSFPDPALTEIDTMSGSTGDHYHASGCGQYVYKRISFIKCIHMYFLTTYAYKHMHLITRVYGNSSGTVTWLACCRNAKSLKLQDCASQLDPSFAWPVEVCHSTRTEDSTEVHHTLFLLEGGVWGWDLNEPNVTWGQNWNYLIRIHRSGNFRVKKLSYDKFSCKRFS